MGNDALILSGGGAKGDFQSGAIHQLVSMDVDFKYVAGVSVGALNGIMVATHQVSNMLDIWQNISNDQVYRDRGKFKYAKNFLLYKLGLKEPNLGYLSNKPLRALLTNKTLGKRVRSHFYTGIVNARTGIYSEHNIDGEYGYLVSKKDVLKILASTAIPGVFDPVMIEGDYYVDGGVRHVTPIGDILKNHNPDKIYIVVTQSRSRGKNNRTKDVLDIVKNSFDYLMQQAFQRDIDRFIEINRMVRQADEKGVTLYKKNGEKYAYYDYEIIYPEQSLGDSLDFDAEKARKNIQHGKEMAMKIHKQ